MRVLVTGGRDYEDRYAVYAVLDRIHAAYGIALLIHGACHLGGADILAEDWAKLREIPYFGLPAKFKTGSRGKAEGMIRNVKMLEMTSPDLVVGFPGGTGTAGCLAEAKKRNIIRLRYDNGELKEDE
jgi:hypothetical protein